MNIELRRAEIQDREILANLLEKYIYEFSQYKNSDVNRLGLFGYPHLDLYWTEADRHPYFIDVDGNIAGFVLVGNFPEAKGTETDFCIAEFCVLYKYRRGGVGKKALFQVLDLYRGRWQVKRHPRNLTSVYFWDAVIEAYTAGQYKLIQSCPDAKCDDGVWGDVFFFDNSGGNG